MPIVRVILSLPYALGLPVGAYQTAPAGEAVEIGPPVLDEMTPQTTLSATFEHADDLDPDQKERERFSDADRLLRRTNRLLRWYRAVRRRADITERTRAQASPFRFELVGAGDPVGWTDLLRHEETGPAPLDLSVDELANRVRDGLMSGGDPDVDVLFLLDAERAVQQGRFREAVLFCWSTIDSVFNRRYDTLVDASLAGEWAEARAFFKGYDFGLRNKMSAGMRFVAGRSLFAEPAELWTRLSTSYNKRNDIIHRGENATEDEARTALDVARTVVQIMREVALAAAIGGQPAND
jgi:hypothetical protein